MHMEYSQKINISNFAFGATRVSKVQTMFLVTRQENRPKTNGRIIHVVQKEHICDSHETYELGAAGSAHYFRNEYKCFRS